MAGAVTHLNAKSTPLTLSTSYPRRPLFSARRLNVVAMSGNQSYWASIEADIEAHLKKAVPIRPPLSVFEPMHYLTFVAPRTTAPALCIAACEVVGGLREQAMAAASALHLAHATTYAHEHLPLTDRPKPKPKPKIYHAYGPNVELLTGDGITPFGLELLARSNGPAQNTPDQILRVIIEIARAVGSQGIVDGQYRKFLCSQADDSEGLFDPLSWVEKNEGGLHACGAACGAILGGGTEEEVEKLRKFGLFAGMMQGMLFGSGQGRNEKEKAEEIERLRVMAFKVLEDIKGKGRNVEPISGLIQVDEANANHLCNA